MGSAQTSEKIQAKTDALHLHLEVQLCQSIWNDIIERPTNWHRDEFWKPPFNTRINLMFFGFMETIEVIQDFFCI